MALSAAVPCQLQVARNNPLQSASALFKHTVTIGHAPLCQVAFKGYAGTLGASYVQHLLTDRRLPLPPRPRCGARSAALAYDQSDRSRLPRAGSRRRPSSREDILRSWFTSRRATIR